MVAPTAGDSVQSGGSLTVISQSRLPMHPTARCRHRQSTTRTTVCLLLYWSLLLYLLPMCAGQMCIQPASTHPTPYCSACAGSSSVAWWLPAAPAVCTQQHWCHQIRRSKAAAAPRPQPHSTAPAGESRRCRHCQTRPTMQGFPRVKRYDALCSQPASLAGMSPNTPTPGPEDAHFASS